MNPEANTIVCEFIMHYPKSGKGKMTSEIKFRYPDHPDLDMGNEVREIALAHVGQLCAAVLGKGLPE